MANTKLLGEIPDDKLESGKSTKGEATIVFGGVSKKKLMAYYGSIENFSEKSAKIRGDIAADWKNFEEEGGNKAALKHAMRVARMSPEKARDYMRCFLDYLEGCEIDEDKQLDLFGDNSASLLVKAEPAKPSEEVLKSVN